MDKLKQAHEDGVVLGLKEVTGLLPRLDVDVMLTTQPDTFNLFLLALRALQDEGMSKDKNGYFELASIHGLPKGLWDGVDPLKDPENNWFGYCAHSRLVFPVWHRPYLAQYEQALYLTMIGLIESFVDEKVKANYRDAAQLFRLPYWDYYRPRGDEVHFAGVTQRQAKQTSFPFDFSLPQIFTMEEVMVRLPPSNEIKLVKNPLYTYKFPPEAKSKKADWKDISINDWRRQTTVRHIPSGQPLRSDHLAMNARINSNREGEQQILVDMLFDPVYANFESFATNTNTTGPSGSLEDFHNTYHWIIGGTGQMGDPTIAAFDPVFWIHHCNIDRYFAIWQGIHPKVWFNANSPDSVEEEAFPLYPFRRSKGDSETNLWKSTPARSTDTFGYTYPDLQEASGPEEIRTNIRNKYFWSMRTKPWPSHTPPKGFEPLPVVNAQVFQYNQALIKPFFANTLLSAQTMSQQVQSLTQIASDNQSEQVVEAAKSLVPLEVSTSKIPDNSNATGATVAGSQEDHNPLVAVKESADSDVIREWFVDFVVQRLALNGTFSIHYFVGEVTGSVEEYDYSPTTAGTSHIFTAPVEACDNCGMQEQQAKIVQGTTALTPILMDYVQIGELESLSPDHVKPFLIKNLKWRVATVDQKRENPRHVAGLKVSVSSKVARLPLGSEPPAYEEYPEITEQIIANSS
ncbi:MAG: hypothetical protein Q9195_007863 [Heterodermia aff. obscurata]